MQCPTRFSEYPDSFIWLWIREWERSDSQGKDHDGTLFCTVQQCKWFWFFLLLETKRNVLTNSMATCHVLGTIIYCSKDTPSMIATTSVADDLHTWVSMWTWILCAVVLKMFSWIPISSVFTQERSHRSCWIRSEEIVAVHLKCHRSLFFETKIVLQGMVCKSENWLFGKWARDLNVYWLIYPHCPDYYNY
jgi:hypothetical protein